VFGNNYEPKVLSQFLLVPADDFPQAAPNAIANDCTSEAT
jgi:hypothetical protein